LIEKAHKKGIKIILDAVLNHTGRGFWQFNHILENGNKSPYIDWFIVHDWPLRPYSNNEEMPINYEAWWGYPELPKLNTNNSFVQDYLFEMTEYWMDFGIDGWRIDVPMEINAPGFWEKFRKVVKKANPEAYIVGEVWGEAKEWLAGDRFDAVMNYIFANNAINYFGAKTININRFSHDKFKVEATGSREFGKRIDEMMKLYDWEITQSQLNLLDSHDMPRALWIMGNDKSALKLLVLFQMTMPGAPCVYYGDEVGLSSAGDPHCREAYPWGDRKRIDQDLHSFYKKLISLRNSNSVLRTGTYKTLYSDDDVFAFNREDDQNSVIVLFNSNQKEINVVFDTQNEVIESKLWSINGERLINIEGENKIQVKAREGVVIFFLEKFTKPLKFNILI